MSAEILRRAAEGIRKGAERADASRFWPSDNHDGMDETVTWGELIANETVEDDYVTGHLATFADPTVALAVAKAMDDVALAWEICEDGWTLDMDGDAIPFGDTVDAGWVAVARAYLGES